MAMNVDGGYVYLDPTRSMAQPGLTRRDWLAGLAMQGIRANVGSVPNSNGISELAYKDADAMIAEGKK